jgi:hypothetical protein
MDEAGHNSIETCVGTLVESLHQLAKEGERSYEDPACLALFGVVRDCAFQLEQQLAMWRRCPKSQSLSAGIRAPESL